MQNPCGKNVYVASEARWVGISSSGGDPRRLHPNPTASLAVACPAPATKPC